MSIDLYSTDANLVNDSPLTIYLEAWLHNASKTEGIYYSSTFQQVSFDISITNPCSDAAIVENQATLIRSDTQDQVQGATVPYTLTEHAIEVSVDGQFVVKPSVCPVLYQFFINGVRI